MRRKLIRSLYVLYGYLRQRIQPLFRGRLKIWTHAIGHAFSHQSSSFYHRNTVYDCSFRWGSRLHLPIEDDKLEKAQMLPPINLLRMWIQSLPVNTMFHMFRTDIYTLHSISTFSRPKTFHMYHLFIVSCAKS